MTSTITWTLAALLPIGGFAAMTYDDLVERWRQERETALKADEGWLTLAGLFWLHDGANTVGSDASSAIRLTRGPARVGVIDWRDGKAMFRGEPGIEVTINGKPESSAAALKSDAGDAKPDVVRWGDISFFVIHRGARDGVRVKDRQSEYRKQFTGLHWYPVREDFRVTAKWVPYETPKLLAVPNILGETEKEPNPGYAVFKLHGQDFRLYPVIEGKELFFIFHDQTAGKETYPSGRFLHSEMPKDSKVELDFNKSYNPPCAFTPYATCPLPPKENRMAIRIEAGELNYGHH